MATCFICKNPGLEIIYNSLLDLIRQEKENPTLKNLTFNNYLNYILNEEGLTKQAEYDYLSQKIRIERLTTFKFKNQMNMIVDGPCSTKHADIIELLAKENYIIIKPKNGELFGDIEKWGKEWRKGY